MKSIRNLLAGTALAAGALLTAGTVFSIATAADETTPAPTTPPPGGHHGWHHHHHGMWFLSKLGLSDQQKAEIKTIMQTNGAQMKSLHQQMHSNSLKLEQTTPDDANYSNLVSQTAAANAPLHQQLDTLMATTRGEIYAKLTPAQKTQLLALKAQMEARRAARGAAT